MALRLSISACIAPCILVVLYELLLRSAEATRDRALTMECGPTPTPLYSALDEGHDEVRGVDPGRTAEAFVNPANMHLEFDPKFSRGLIVSYPRSGNHLLRVIIEFLTKRRTT